MAERFLGMRPNEGQDLIINLEENQLPVSLRMGPQSFEEDDTNDASILLKITNTLDDGTVEQVNGTLVEDEDTTKAGAVGGDKAAFSGTLATVAGDATYAVIPGTVNIHTLAESDDEVISLEDTYGDGVLYDEDGNEAGSISYFTSAWSGTFSKNVKASEAIDATFYWTTEIPLNGRVTLIPTDADTRLPILPRWGRLSIQGFVDVAKAIAVEAQITDDSSGIN